MNQYQVAPDGSLHEVWVQEWVDGWMKEFPGSDPLALEANLLLVRAFGTVNSLVAPISERAGLTPARTSVLGLLHLAPDKRMSIGEVAAGMNVTSGNVTQVVGGLVKQGLVRRTTDPADRRTTMVELTPKGELALLNVRHPQMRRVSSLYASLTEKEKLLMIHLLSKLRMVLLARYAEDETAASLEEDAAPRKRRGAVLRPVDMSRKPDGVLTRMRRNGNGRNRQLDEDRADA